MTDDTFMNPTVLDSEIASLEICTPIENAWFKNLQDVQRSIAILETSALPQEQIDFVRKTLQDGTKGLHLAAEEQRILLKKLKALKNDRRWINATKSITSFFKK